MKFCICINMDGLGGHNAMKCQTWQDKYCMLSLICGMCKIYQARSRFIDTENKLAVTSREKGRASITEQIVKSKL